MGYQPPCCAIGSFRAHFLNVFLIGGGPKAFRQKNPIQKLRPEGIRRQAKVSLNLACQLVGADVVLEAPTAPTASRINWAISSGCATYDA